jgi:tetrahydromethanopterin S-methyltransferase subunit G
MEGVRMLAQTHNWQEIAELGEVAQRIDCIERIVELRWEALRQVVRRQRQREIEQLFAKEGDE